MLRRMGQGAFVEPSGATLTARPLSSSDRPALRGAGLDATPCHERAGMASRSGAVKRTMWGEPRALLIHRVSNPSPPEGTASMLPFHDSRPGLWSCRALDCGDGGPRIGPGCLGYVLRLRGLEHQVLHVGLPGTGHLVHHHSGIRGVGPEGLAALLVECSLSCCAQRRRRRTPRRLSTIQVALARASTSSAVRRRRW